jgi:hypothetical protein
VTLGVGELLVIAVLIGEQPAVDGLRPAVGLLILFNLVVLALLVADIHRSCPGFTTAGRSELPVSSSCSPGS